MENREFLQKLMAKDVLHVLYSPLTHVPFTVCDETTFDDKIFVYAGEDLAKAAADEWNKAGESVNIVPLDKNNYLGMFAELYSLGINAISMTTKEESRVVQLSEVVVKKPKEKLPHGVNMPDNSSLSCSLIYFLQEARKAQEKRDMKKLHDMDEEIMANLSRGQFLLPMQVVEEKGKKLNRLMLVKLPDGGTAFPVFTDPMAFAHTKPQKGAMLVQTDLKRLLSNPGLDKIKGIVLNPGGFGFFLPLASVQKIIKEYGE